MTNSIEVNGLCKSYGDFQLDHVDLTLPGGAILGLIGENGAGKSTTIKCILNLIRRDEGTIRVFGQDNIECDQAIKQDVGVVLDECFFHDSLRASDVDAILRRIYRKWDRALFRRYCQQFSLPEKKTVKEYSRGMKMKLSIAASLSHHADFLLLDEATGGLDPVVREEILELFQEFMEEEGHTILMSSHITSDLEKIADYVAFMKDGRMVFQEEKDVLLSGCGILKCGRDDFRDMDCPVFLASREHVFGREILLRDRHSFEAQYPEAVVDPVKLEDIMLFLVKGEQL